MPSPTVTNHLSTDYVGSELEDEWVDVTHPNPWVDGNHPDQWAPVRPPVVIEPGFREYCLEKLRDLERLRPGWDYAEAPPIDSQIIDAVREFVSSLPRDITPRPMVVPLSSGGVQLEWHRGRLTLELEFESPEQVHYLKWDPDNRIEEEEVISTSHRDGLIGLIRWFVKRTSDA